MKRWKLWDNKVWSGPVELPDNRDVMAVSEHERIVAELQETLRGERKLLRERDLCIDIALRERDQALAAIKKTDERHRTGFDKAVNELTVVTQERDEAIARVNDMHEIILEMQFKLRTLDTEGVSELTGILYQRDATIESLTSALNRIAIMASGELAYTAEFTERVDSVVRDALKIPAKRWPY